MENLEKESALKAGILAAEVKTFARSIIKPGMKLIDIALLIDNKIKELGAEPAFPVNLSLNDTAAHFTPTLDCTDTAEGILKVDIGVAINGYIADTAITFDLTQDKMYTNLIAANKTVLHEIMNILTPKSQVRDVGNTAHAALENFNKKHGTRFSMIHGLCGHSIAQNIIHAGLTIPNYSNENKTALAEKLFAIEPFVTTGRGEIYEGEGGGIYGLRGTDKPRDKDARIVLDFIKEQYKTRPFCSRWLEKAGLKKVKYSLAVLEKQGIIHHYPLLMEKSGGAVSQFENSFLITDNHLTITTFEKGWMEK
jgi:methionyl aminopeptidase